MTVLGQDHVRFRLGAALSPLEEARRARAATARAVQEAAVARKRHALAAETRKEGRMFGGLKALIVDHFIAATLKGAAEGKYGPFLKKLYWATESHAAPISVILGAAEAGVAYGCHAHYAWACTLDTGLVAPALTGVLGLLGITVGVHASAPPLQDASAK